MIQLELAAFAVVVCIAAVILVARGRAGRRWSRVAVAIAAALVASGVVAKQWRASVDRDQARRVRDAASRPAVVPIAGYVTSNTCQACHPHEYATWHRSYHRTMTQVATPEAVIGDFDGTVLRRQDRTYELSRRGDEFWISVDAPAADGGVRHLDRKIQITTGSHLQQVYWFSPDGSRSMQLFEFGYRVDQQRWMPIASMFIAPPGKMTIPSAGTWNRGCSRCHATGIVPGISGRKSPETRAGELGIACEACHGEADEHVRANRDPRRRFDKHLSGDEDPTIVDPTDLSHKAGSQVCGQCHSVFGWEELEGREDYFANGFRYRPGAELSASRALAYCRSGSNLTERCEDWFWTDGMIRVTGREYHGLVESPCYQRGEMSCFSCHRMHPEEGDQRPLGEWANNQLGHEMDGDRACLQCHDASLGETAHTRHPPSSAGSRCYNCHMPNTTWGVQQATRSHQVSSPSAAATDASGRPNACNLCHLDRSLGWTAQQLHELWGLEEPQLSDDQRTIAASIIGLLSGDAGQRALYAWHLSWEPAREASGQEWMAPHLAPLLEDPYDTVRYVAENTLRTLEPYDDVPYSFFDPAPARAAGRELLQARWVAAGGAPGRAGDQQLLVGRDGQLRQEIFDRLLAARDDRPMHLAE